MSIINNIIALAKKQVGITEYPPGSNKVKYNTEYYGRVVSGSDYPWCCAFIWWLFKECDASELFYGGKKTASCTTLMNYYKKKGQFSQTPKVGSLVFFQFDKDPQSEHIGIVTKVSGNTIYTIEGNTSVSNDSNGGEVMTRTRYMSQILGFAYPYSEGTTTTTGGSSKVNVTVDTVKNGSKGDSVKALQILLNGLGFNCGTADGDAGAKTVAAIKKFQKAKGLTADGVAGKNTWNAILN